MTCSARVLRRPIVRWHGGKWLLAHWIIGHFPAHRCYVEPYGGGGSVLLRKERSYAEVYNDLDGDIVNLFRVMRDHGCELAEAVRLTPYSREDFRASYHAHTDQVEQARRLLVRCYMGFGTNAHGRITGFRANSNRSGTTPAHDWANFPAAIPAIIERLRGVVIENRPAIDVMRQHDSAKTLHYVDPPYLPETRDKGRDYAHEMTQDDHVALSSALHSLRGAVVISGYRSPLYDELYADWIRVDRNALADGAKKRIESLWLSTPPPQSSMI